jgi:predicted RNA methylase
MANQGGGARSRPRRIKYTIESLGWRRGVLETVSHRFVPDAGDDRSFDRRFGTDTAGAVEVADLGIGDECRRGQAIRYLPSPAGVTRWMLNHVDVDHATRTFIDLGCGKGRVLLVASEYPFRRVIGVDISSELGDIARRNVERFRTASRRCAEVDVVTGDVTSFDFPDGDLVIHLYHPFESEVTEAVLRRLQVALDSAPRRVTVAYLAYTAAVQSVQAVFARFPLWHQTRYEQSVRGHYDWLVYTN